MTQKRAFAVIELLVDLALVAILIGIIIPYYKSMEKQIASRISRREIRMLKVAVISYYENQKSHSYPSTTNNLCRDYLLAAQPQVIKTVMFDPFLRREQEYHYAVSPNAKFYCIWSVGMNRRSNIQAIDDSGSVIKDKNCDDIFATNTLDPAE